MQKHVIVAIFLLLVFAVPGFAQSFSDFSVNYEVQPEQVLVTYDISYQNFLDLNIGLPLDAHDIIVLLDKTAIDFQLISGEQEQLLSIPVQTLSGKLSITYATRELLHASNKNFFLSEIRPSFPIDVLNVQVSLTEGTGLLNPISDDDQPVFPLPDTITSDGQNILLQWHRTNVSGNDSIVFLVFLKTAVPLSLLIGVVFILLIVALGLGYLLKHKKTRYLNPFARKQYVEKEFEFAAHLLEKEKAILESLKKATNKTMKQKDLQTQTGFSKAKLSRTLKDLQVRGLIEVVPYGNTNLVKLLPGNK